MGRRKRGQPVDGWVVLDKPLGMTSTQAVGRVRRAFNAQKAGHAGTLDPLATGILAVALGEATKTIPVVTDAPKAYRFTVRWGQATATDDAEGAVIAESDKRPDKAAIAAALPVFTGDIMQVPPQFSAVKVDGARAYDLAREGETIDLAARPLHVAKLTLVDLPDRDHAVLEMICGKGGYVRAIARDLGAALGCHAHVRSLRRIWSGPFTLDNAVAPDAVDAAPNACLRPVALGLAALPSVPVTLEAAAHLRQGRPVPVACGTLAYGDAAWASLDGAPVALGSYRGGLFHPSRVIAPGV